MMNYFEKLFSSSLIKVPSSVLCTERNYTCVESIDARKQFKE